MSLAINRIEAAGATTGMGTMFQYNNPVDIEGQLSTAAAANPRKAERATVDLGAGLRQRGASNVTVQILDLSTHGFRASTHLDLQTGADVWLKLPGLEALHAKVAWSNAHFVGCAFERPLHPAVLQMMVKK
jgi:hypothetical protein